MPAPVVVYYVAALGTVLTVIALKQFIYDPHIAPAVSAWKESITEHRRRGRDRRERVLVPVAVRNAPDSLDLGPGRSRPSVVVKHADAYGDDISVEMRNLVERETAEWMSSSQTAGLRRRNVKAADVLDESNSFVPYTSLAPTPLSANSTAPASPASTRTLTLASPPVIHSPLPRTPIRAHALSSAAGSERTSPQLSTPMARTVALRDDSPAARSNSTTSSFTPAVIGPGSPRYGSPRSESGASDAARSTTYDIVSPPGSSVVSPAVAPQQPHYSPIMSPFSDVQRSPQFLRSPSPVILSPSLASSFRFTSGGESETAILSPSLRSGMFSPGFNVDDDPFELASEVGDDMSDWESLHRRTPSP